MPLLALDRPESRTGLLHRREDEDLILKEIAVNTQNASQPNQNRCCLIVEIFRQSTATSPESSFEVISWSLENTFSTFIQSQGIFYISAAEISLRFLYHLLIKSSQICYNGKEKLSQQQLKPYAGSETQTYPATLPVFVQSACSHIHPDSTSTDN